MSHSPSQRHRSVSKTTDLQGEYDCPECRGSLVTDGSETRCQECGLVVDEQQIDYGPEWRSFEDGDDRARIGAPLTQARHDRGLSTTIGRGHNATDNSLSARKRRQLARLRREHARAQAASKADRNLRSGLGEIARIVSALGLARSAREQASQLFRTAQRENLLVGRSIEGVAAASVYAVCRLTGLSRSLDEVVAVAQRQRGQVANCYNVLNQELDLPVPPRRAEEFVPSLASAVGLPMTVERQASQIAAEADDQGVACGKDPCGVAAACLKVAADEQGLSVTQATVADAADVCIPTVRAGQRAIQAMLDR
ncbi:transcription initiation factor IIB family protein [Halorientalis brevis]|uniref:Transcription initiation factor IIB family protein n=1 Tax=Halorientalis brevis TaxID=1126241 RepID=A0ABD6CE42_9EURY|nr:TFIIB-type zinc ribbon-containing protein [Halorientalis brevis]